MCRYYYFIVVNMPGTINCITYKGSARTVELSGGIIKEKIDSKRPVGGVTTYDNQDISKLVRI